MCKGKKQTNIKNAQSNTHSHSSPLPLLPYSDPTTPLPSTTIPLPLPGIILFSFWFFVLFCIHKTNSKRSFFTLCCWCNGKSFNTWLFLQLRLESAISKYFSDLLLKVLISCYNTLYRDTFSILLSCCSGIEMNFFTHQPIWLLHF